MKLFFKIIAYLEGISYLCLFANMFVIKNIDLDLYKKILYPLGMAHGLLFVLYVVLAIYLAVEYKWSIKKTIYILVASVLPFGTFYSEKKWIERKF